MKQFQYFYLICGVIGLCWNASCQAPNSKETQSNSNEAKQTKQEEISSRLDKSADSAQVKQKRKDKQVKEQATANTTSDTTALPTLTTDCQNCGMPAEDFPTWRVRVETAKQAHHFCSPKCYFSRQLKPNKAITQVSKVFFKDYYTQTFVEEKNVCFVIKSKITGPMGADLVPFGDETAAKEFLTDHQGKQILRPNEVVEQVLNSLK